MLIKEKQKIAMTGAGAFSADLVAIPKVPAIARAFYFLNDPRITHDGILLRA